MLPLVIKPVEVPVYIKKKEKKEGKLSNKVCTQYWTASKQIEVVDYIFKL